jgi:hypothetical protein
MKSPLLARFRIASPGHFVGGPAEVMMAKNRVSNSIESGYVNSFHRIAGAPVTWPILSA